MYGQSRQNTGRTRLHLAVDALRYRDVALRSVRITRGPDEIRLSRRSPPGASRGDQRREGLANNLFAVALAYSGDAEAQVQEFDALGAVPPSEYFFEKVPLQNTLRFQAVRSSEIGSYDSGADTPSGSREDDEIGAPGHALRVVRETGNVLSRDNAGNRSAVRGFAAVVASRTREKPLDDRLVSELRMGGVDPRIQHADGDAFARH